MTLNSLKRRNADSCCIRAAMMGEWNRAGKDYRARMRQMPPIDERMERRAECLMEAREVDGPEATNDHS